MLTLTKGSKVNQFETDHGMMRHCIRLSKDAAAHGEFPFAAVICGDGQFVVEATDEVAHGADVTRHAQLIAVSQAQNVLRRNDRSSCTLHSNVEQCPMCSFPIRETRIGRVVNAIGSPLMGGFSKWNILRDE